MIGPKCHVLVRTVVIFRIVIFNSWYTAFIWSLGVSVYDIFVFLPPSTPVNKHISRTGGFRLSVRPSVSSIDACQTFIPCKTLSSMNVGLMQILHAIGDICPVMTKIKYMYTTTRACTQCPTLIVNVASRYGNLKLVNPFTNLAPPILAYFLLPTIKST